MSLKQTKRNYISELHDFGYTYKRIAKETGYSKDMVASIAIGRRKLPKSGTKRYEDLRNACRRATFAFGRDRGLTSKYATELRRKVPEEVKKFKGAVWKVKGSKLGMNECILHVVGDFYSYKAEAWAYDIKCYSAAHAKLELELMIAECESQGQSQLGGTDWRLVKIKSYKIIDVILEK